MHASIRVKTASKRLALGFALAVWSVPAPTAFADEPQAQQPQQQQREQQPAQQKPGEEQRPRARHQQIAKTVELKNLEENPREFLNQKVTVSGEIENIVGPRLFTIDEKEWVDFDGEILVAVPAPLAVMAREDTPVRVTGTVRPFVRTEIEPEWGWFETDGVEAEFSQRAVLVADSVTTTDEVEVAVRMNFTGEQPRPTGAAGSTTTGAAPNATAAANRVSDLGRLAQSDDQSLVGSRVDIKGAKVAAVADRGGFWVAPASGAEHLFVLPTEPKGGPISEGQTVDISGWVFQLPRGMKDRIDTPQIDARGEEVYVYATRVSKAGGQ